MSDLDGPSFGLAGVERLQSFVINLPAVRKRWASVPVLQTRGGVALGALLFGGLMNTSRCVVACLAGSLFALPCYGEGMRPEQEGMPQEQIENFLSGIPEFGAGAARAAMIEQYWREVEAAHVPRRVPRVAAAQSPSPPPSSPEPQRDYCPDGSYRSSPGSPCPVPREQPHGHCPDGSDLSYLPCSLHKKPH